MMWKVTAGTGNAAVGQFLEKQIVAIGFSTAGDFTDAKSKDDLVRRFAESNPGQRPQSINVRAGQAWRFMHGVNVGDSVLTYDPGTRLYHLGKITSDVSYKPDLIEGLGIVRSVSWSEEVSRDALSVATKNSLGAIMTIFKLPPEAAAEINSLALGKTIEVPDVVGGATDEAEIPDPFADISDQALERIKDRILALDWEEMQQLVAALLRSLGYRTIVSAAGADRGRDIVASRDGFGFEAPRIVVEVKHRRGQMGAPEIRAFLGGRHAEDRGLYVSTGGFTREAQYEAERAATVTHLMSLDGLARALIDQYEALDETGRALLPLTKIYWPA